ncbi:MAG: ferrochelatase, partial [candidate division Zixibacteria bacterium]|nr:ferrochelatase [candidate division Zixibacteria bacterium]
AVPKGREEEAGREVGRHHILTHCYWREAGAEFNNVNIMGVAHGTDKELVLAHKAAIDEHLASYGMPVSYIKRGDPYAEHVTRSVGLVTKRLGWPSDRTSLAYQSRLGPVEWLGPYTDHLLAELAREGERRVLVCPIAFTVDCLETLEELNIRGRADYLGAGGEEYLFVPSLNTHPEWVKCVARMVAPEARAC